MSSVARWITNQWLNINIQFREVKRATVTDPQITKANWRRMRTGNKCTRFSESLAKLSDIWQRFVHRRKLVWICIILFYFSDRLLYFLVRFLLECFVKQKVQLFFSRISFYRCAFMLKTIRKLTSLPLIVFKIKSFPTFIMPLWCHSKRRPPSSLILERKNNKL